MHFFQPVKEMPIDNELLHPEEEGWRWDL